MPGFDWYFSRLIIGACALEIVAFTLVGIGLYFFSDWVLAMLEKIHGEPLPHRNIVFFVVILVLATSSFGIIRTLMQSKESPQHNNEEQQPADGGNQATQAH